MVAALREPRFGSRIAVWGPGLVWGFYARSADAVFALRGSEGSVQSLLVYAGSARGIYVPVLARYKKLVFASVLHHASSHSARRRAHVLDHLA